MTSPRQSFTRTRANQFGPEYEQLLLTVWAKTPFRFPFPTGKDARAMRGKVYAYFRSLREENLRLDLIEIADAITLTLENDNVLIFQRNEETWDHDRIRNILGITKDDYGLRPADGTELAQPDLLGTRLTRQLTKLRERDSGGKKIVPPQKL
jgi:hypothetical protein